MKYELTMNNRDHLAADKTRTQVIMTKEKYRRLREQADRLGISYSSYINILISSTEQGRSLLS